MSNDELLDPDVLLDTCVMVEPIKCGIYFLVFRTRIVYVGRAVDIIERMRQHTRDGKMFDRWTWVACAPEHQPRLERQYIDMLLPDYNRDALTMRRKAEESVIARGMNRRSKRAGQRPTPANCFWRGDVLWGRFQAFDKEYRVSLRTSDPQEAARRVVTWIRQTYATIGASSHNARHSGTVCDNFAHLQPGFNGQI